VSLLCANRGDRIAVLDKDEDSAVATAAEAGFHRALGMQCDVTREEQIEQAFKTIFEKFGPPYGLFANAGVDFGGLTHELPLEKWRLVLETNLTGVFLSCKHALKRMIDSNIAGSIVCTSSPTGFVAMTSGGAGAYSASKAGISALVRCMAVDYARFGIRVNSIVPGATETPLMWSNVAPHDVPGLRQRISDEVPLGRLAEPGEPARGVAWLLSEESSYVTGSNLVCDGGILAKASISV
jgi:NAD(P)-dependent dehydrogenase (short-subunit alcohol dehydrogenase family)